MMIFNYKVPDENYKIRSIKPLFVNFVALIS